MVPRENGPLKKRMNEGARIMDTIYLAGGCFWGIQKFFDQFDGVISTEVVFEALFLSL